MEYIIYPYQQKVATKGNRYATRYCVANPVHPYPYECKGVTMASGFKSEETAQNWISTHK